jgi:hypothetical protein
MADLVIYQGDDWACEVGVLNPATGGPLDLAGYDAHAQFRVAHAQWTGEVVLEPEARRSSFLR